MPSPEVIDHTLSDDEIQPDPIRSDRGPPAPNQATNRFRASSSIREPLHLSKQQTGSEQVLQFLSHLASTELEGFFQSFKVLLQPSNELKIFFHSNLSSTTLHLDKHSSTVFTTSTGLGYLTSTLWRLGSTHTSTTVLSQKSL